MSDERKPIPPQFVILRGPVTFLVGVPVVSHVRELDAYYGIERPSEEEDSNG